MASDNEVSAAYRSFVVNECLRLGVPEGDIPDWEPFNLLICRLESAVRAADWKPMGCAPRDGREVLLVVECRAGIPGKQLVGHYMPGGHCIEDHPAIDEGWYFWNGCRFDKASKPLAWMELPVFAGL